MIKHIIMWTLKDELTNKEEVKNKIKTDLENLPQSIKEIVDIKITLNKGLTKSLADIYMDSSFNSMEDLQAYLVHDYHKRAGEYIRSVVKDRLSIDYEI